jgi:hypothetical protein
VNESSFGLMSTRPRGDFCPAEEVLLLGIQKAMWARHYLIQINGRTSSGRLSKMPVRR